MTIKAIIWDNWGVIVDAKCGSIVKVWSDLLNAPIEGIAKVFSGDELNQLQAAEITTEEYYDYVIRELNLPEESKDLLRNEPMEPYAYDEDLISYIRKLKKRLHNRISCKYRSQFTKENFRLLARGSWYV